MSKKRWCLIVLFIILSITGCSKKTTPIISGTDFIMNTVIEQRWYGNNSQQVYDEITKSLKEIEKSLSLYILDSEIDKINKNAGIDPVKVSKQTFDIIATAISYCEQSQGKFDITIAPLTTLWDITSKKPKVPSQSSIDKARRFVGYENITLDEKNLTVFLSKYGMSIDLGGVAKGIATSFVCNIPKDNNVSGYLSIGGNLMVVGKKDDGNDFKFGVRDPNSNANEFIATVTLDGMTMATSGTYERFFVQNDIKYHHIIDVSTGYPAQNDLVSVSVISKDGGLADYLSTAIFIDGLENIEKHLTSEEYFVIVVDKKNNIYTSESYRSNITPNPEKNNYNFVGYDR